MKKLLLLLFPLYVQAGIITKQFKSANVVYNVIIYTPDNASASFPAFIFFTGSGESGNNASLIYANGPLHFVQAGWKPNFIVIGVQSPSSTAPSTPALIKTALDSLLNPIYRIDPARWYLTGLSYGAGSICGYMQNATDAQYLRPAAMLPMSISISAQCGDFYAGTEELCKTDLRYAQVPFWGFCGRSDSFYDKMFEFFTLLQKAGYNCRFTTIPAQGHCCWNDRYDPNYKENGVSIYDWALAQVGPLALSYVNLEYMDGLLTWSVDDTNDIDHFEIQQSDDSKNFRTISITDAYAYSVQ